MPILSPSPSSSVTAGEASLYGWVATPADPVITGQNAFGLTGNFINAAIAVAIRDATLANFLTVVAVAGTTVAGARAGVWAGTTGVLLGQTADVSAAWQSTGVKTMALTAQSAGSLTVRAGDLLILGCYIASSATAPQMRRSSLSAGLGANDFLSSPNYRACFANVGAGGLPSTLPAMSPDNQIPLFAVA